MTATKILGRSGAFFAGTMLTFSGVTPAFAATLDAAQLTPSNLILLGSLILLGIGLALKVMTRRRTLDVGPESPDLRWWNNP